MSELGVQAELIIGEISSCSERNITIFQDGYLFWHEEVWGPHSGDPHIPDHQPCRHCVTPLRHLAACRRHQGRHWSGHTSTPHNHHGNVGRTSAQSCGTAGPRDAAGKLMGSRSLAKSTIYIKQVGCWSQYHGQGQQVILCWWAAGVKVIGKVNK